VATQTDSFRPVPPDHAVKIIPLVALAATLGASSPGLAAGNPFCPPPALNDFLQNYHSAGLKNGCLPEAYIFSDRLRQRFPETRPRVILLELPDGPTALYGHAVVVFRSMARLYLWDHEAGLVPLNAQVSADEIMVRSEAVESYLRAVARLKASPPTRCGRTANGREACQLAVRLLGDRRPELLRYRTPRQGCCQAVAFAGGGLVWVYLPESGTAFVPNRMGCSPAQLMLAALRTAVPQAELVPGVPVAAPRNPLAPL